MLGIRGSVKPLGGDDVAPNEIPDKLFVSIAVSRPENLVELPGAITAAERMAEWASANGYATLLVHDKKHPVVSVELLRSEIMRAIESITKDCKFQRFQRLVFFFAGHGAALAVGDQYWLLSYWQQRSSEAIKVSSLQRILEYYGPVQVAIIGDACQEFSSQFIDVVGSPILDRTDEDPRPYELDQFFAVDVAKQAFMIRAAGTKDAFCVFSEVLLDALEGEMTSDCGLDVDGPDQVVTSQSIARFLTSNVPAMASKYGVRMTPRPRPGFFTDRVYKRVTKPGGAASPSAAMRPGTVTRSAGGPVADSPGRGRRQASSFRNTTRFQLEGDGPQLTPYSSASESPAQVRQREFETRVRHQMQKTQAFPVKCGLLVTGASVESVAVNAEIRPHGPLRFEVLYEATSHRHGSLDTVVTLRDGRSYCLCLVPGFVTELVVLDPLTATVLHRSGTDSYELDADIDLLAKAHAGILAAPDLQHVANSIRGGKHRVLTVGCIAAQFYDLMRDSESLRSMANFYVSRQQPVPLDIVLYGGGTLLERDGELYALTKPLPASERRTRHWETAALEFEGASVQQPYPVAGRIPWMRHAWGAIATARYDTSAARWKATAEELLQHLAPGIFTNVHSSGRALALDLAGISAQKQKPAPVPA